MKRRILALLLALAAMTTWTSAAEILNQSSLRLSDHMKLSTAYAEHGGDAVREQLLTYEPGGDVQPMVVYGDTLYGRSTMDYIQEHLSKQGYTAAAAINAAFFDMTSGIPYGLVVTDGILRTSGDVMSVGLTADGRMEIGQPGLEVKLDDAVINYNKVLTASNGLCLYSRDYDTKVKGGLKAYNVILKPETDQLTVSCEVQATVQQIVEDVTNCAIPEGQFVLSLAMDTVYSSAMTSIQALELGDTVTITTTIDDDWVDMTYAVGGGELLVEDGQALSGFTLNTADKQAARTALGIKSNGEVVCYTADRGTGSEGLTLEQLAKRMKDLGCTTAINLDGGGSTCVGVTLPGDEAFTTVNDPSDGQQRPCANFLFFVRPTQTPGAAVRLHVYPYDAAVLPGGQVTLTVKASDRDYMAARVPEGVTCSAKTGVLEGLVYTATRAGTDTVTARAGSLSGSASIHVVETPTAMMVRLADKSTELTDLVIEGGATVDLTAEAQYQGLPLAAQDRSFRWHVPTELGEITEDGVFTASQNNVKGDLTVTCGDLEVTIPVEVRPNPFADTENHWAKSQISNLYYEGVLQGSANADGVMLYRPDDSMTRQEFVAAMMRSTDTNLDDYAETQLPFADLDKIADWALPSVRAAYALGWFTGSGRGEDLYADPQSTITREAAMTILARTISAQSDSDALDEFQDAKTVSDWAKPALTAMVEQQIINGIDGKLHPQGSVTRAQVAKMLYAMS